MPKSMTGYAKYEKIEQNYRVVCEIRSLNSKYLVTDIQSPSFMFGRENELIQSVQNAIKRGKVTLRLYVEFLTPLNAVKVDYGLAKSYYDALEDLVGQLGIPEPVNLDNLLRFRDLVRFELSQQQEQQIFGIVKDVLDKTLKSLDEERTSEGARLAHDLEKILQQLLVIQNGISKFSEESSILMKEKIKQDVKRMLDNDVQLNEDLLENAVVFAVQRADIREELARLKSHLQKAEELLKSNDSVGNHLDFVAQEMFREVNTILSKSQDQRIIDDALRAKVLISQFREQIQNIE
ncbi:MAG TPA: YicC/YloC family endoribonuclease [Pseudothermotoga sp.]